MTEDTRTGGVTWHSSEDDGGPDVGVSLYLGDGKRLWCGEISRDLYDSCRGFDYFDGDGGRFLVFYDPSPRLLAKIGDYDQAREFIEALAFAVREADLPTLAKALGSLTSDNGTKP